MYQEITKELLLKMDYRINEIYFVDYPRELYEFLLNEQEKKFVKRKDILLVYILKEKDLIIIRDPGIHRDYIIYTDTLSNLSKDELYKIIVSFLENIVKCGCGIYHGLDYIIFMPSEEKIEISDLTKLKTSN